MFLWFGLLRNKLQKKRLSELVFKLGFVILSFGMESVDGLFPYALLTNNYFSNSGVESLWFSTLKSFILRYRPKRRKGINGERAFAQLTVSIFFSPFSM